LVHGTLKHKFSSKSGLNPGIFLNFADSYKLQHMLNIVLFGPPGAGKGTQSQKLIEKYNLVHLSTGDLLRSEIAAGTQLGLDAKKFIDNGLLVPDEVVIGMIENKIRSNKDAGGFIFDGFPRTVPQAASLDQMCTENNIQIDALISLRVDEVELTKRIVERGKTSGRSDDQDPVTVRGRISEYNNKTAPVADYYTQKGKAILIDGMQSIDVVFTEICKVIDSFKVNS
jgi:adenylate kinase